MVKQAKSSRSSRKKSVREQSQKGRQWSDFMDRFLQYMLKTYSEDKVWMMFEKLTKIPADEAKRRNEYLTTGLAKRIPFSEAEDAKILELYKAHGPKWSTIAKKLKTRTRKQIRERFLNILDENHSKSPFTLEEDLRLFSLFKKHGNKWAYISTFFPNRTTDKIRIRFHSHIRRRMDYFTKLLNKNL